MALAIVTPKSVVVGGSVTVTGTGFTTSGNVKVKITGPGDNANTEVVVVASGGAFDMGPVAVYKPYRGGLYVVTAKDVTAGTSISQKVRVFGT